MQDIRFRGVKGQRGHHGFPNLTRKAVESEKALQYANTTKTLAANPVKSVCSAALLSWDQTFIFWLGI